MNVNDMSAWGLTERFAALARQYPEFIPGRVVSQEKDLYRVVHSLGEQPAAVSGRFRYEAVSAEDFPAVGDFVMLGMAGADGTAVIHRLLPRASVFTRRAAGTANTAQLVAANVDTVFICMSLNNDFNPRRLERYLAIAWDSGASPVVVLTKADLCGELEAKLAQARAVSAQADVVTTSGLGEGGENSVLPYIGAGRTIAFIGSSGVGKSTLINRLLGAERLATNGLRNDDKGRHTTTRRELMLLPGGGLVIDTPGMRELGMWDAAEGLERAFEDIEELSRSCRYGNCTHTGEPGCAVLAAIENGELSAGRLDSFRRLTAENAYAEDSESYLAQKEKKFKQIARQNRTNRKK